MPLVVLFGPLIVTYILAHRVTFDSARHATHTIVVESANDGAPFGQWCYNDVNDDTRQWHSEPFWWVRRDFRTPQALQVPTNMDRVPQRVLSVRVVAANPHGFLYDPAAFLQSLRRALIRTGKVSFVCLRSDLEGDDAVKRFTERLQGQVVSLDMRALLDHSRRSWAMDDGVCGHAVVFSRSGDNIPGYGTGPPQRGQPQRGQPQRGQPQRGQPQRGLPQRCLVPEPNGGTHSFSTRFPCQLQTHYQVHGPSLNPSRLAEATALACDLHQRVIQPRMWLGEFPAQWPRL